MRFRSGDPLDLFTIDLYDISILVKDLDRGTCDFRSIARIHLADLDRSLFVLNEEHSFIGDSSCTCNIAFLVDREGRLTCDCIAFRRNRLLQSIGDACLKPFDHMRFRSGDPLDLLAVDLYNFSILIKDLDRCARKLLTARDVRLADLHLRLGILHEIDSISFRIRGCRQAGRDRSVFIYCEFNVRRDLRVARRSCLLTKHIRRACNELTAEVMRLILSGSPAVDDSLISRCIDPDHSQDCAFDLLAVCNIRLVHVKADRSVFDQIYDRTVSLC